MLEALESGLGLEIVLALQNLRVDALDTLAQALNIAGEQFFYIALMGVIYWAIQRQLGWRAYFALVVSIMVVFLTKDTLARPRPFVASADVIPLFEAEGFGIPSGHTMVTLVVWGYLAWRARNAIFTELVVIYVGAQAFFRLYAGVHFPQDVVLGLLLGTLTLWLYVRYHERVAAFWDRRTLVQQAMMTAAVGVLGFPLTTISPDFAVGLGLLLGGMIAAMMIPRTLDFRPDFEIPGRAVQAFVGLLLVVAVFLALDTLFLELGLEPSSFWRTIRYGITAWVALVAIPWLSLRAGFMERVPTPQTSEDGKIGEAQPAAEAA